MSELYPIILNPNGSINGDRRDYVGGLPPVTPLPIGVKFEDYTSCKITINPQYAPSMDNQSQRPLNISYEKIKVFPLYCDSISGGGDYSGDGTKEHPWHDFEFALKQIKCFADVTCRKTIFLLHLSGIVDYEVNGYGWAVFDNLIISGGRFSLKHDTKIERALFSYLGGIVFDSCYFFNQKGFTDIFQHLGNCFFMNCRFELRLDTNFEGRLSFSSGGSNDGGIFYRCVVTQEALPIRNGLGFCGGKPIWLIECNISAYTAASLGYENSYNYSIMQDCSISYLSEPWWSGFHARIDHCNFIVDDIEPKVYLTEHLEARDAIIAHSEIKILNIGTYYLGLFAVDYTTMVDVKLNVETLEPDHGDLIGGGSSKFENVDITYRYNGDEGSQMLVSGNAFHNIYIKCNTFVEMITNAHPVNSCLHIFAYQYARGSYFKDCTHHGIIKGPSDVCKVNCFGYGWSAEDSKVVNCKSNDFCTEGECDWCVSNIPGLSTGGK